MSEMIKLTIDGKEVEVEKGNPIEPQLDGNGNPIETVEEPQTEQNQENTEVTNESNIEG